MVTTITILAIALAVAVIVGIYLYKSKQSVRASYDNFIERWREERLSLVHELDELKANHDYQMNWKLAHDKLQATHEEKSKENKRLADELKGLQVSYKEFIKHHEEVEKQFEEDKKVAERQHNGLKGKLKQVNEKNEELAKRLDELIEQSKRVENTTGLKLKLEDANKRIAELENMLVNDLLDSIDKTPETESPEESPADDSTDADNASIDSVSATADNVEWVNSEDAPAPYGEAEQEQVQEQVEEQAQAPASTEQESNDLPEQGQQESSVQEPTPVAMDPIPAYPAEKKLPKRFRKKGKKHGKSVKTLPQD